MRLPNLSNYAGLPSRAGGSPFCTSTDRGSLNGRWRNLRVTENLRKPEHQMLYNPRHFFERTNSLIMNAKTKTLITAISLFVMGVIPGTSIASDADEIQSRVQKVGKLNISGATAEPAAPAEATVTETASTEAAADTASTETASTEAAADTTSTEVASTETAADTASTSQAVDSAALYQASCFACHGTGVAGSPVLGDKEAWAPRIAQGEATLLEHAINGFNAMPPRGGSMLKDDELKAVVAYMVENSQ